MFTVLGSNGVPANGDPSAFQAFLSVSCIAYDITT